jgi:hypothetical protein
MSSLFVSLYLTVNMVCIYELWNIYVYLLPKFLFLIHYLAKWLNDLAAL